jgi:5-(carboxyamino)imidazole ribonucleotide synthase
MILPGAVLGVLGGGQLGRMFTVRAREMGYRVIVLDPDRGSPAGAIADHHIAAQYDDAVALEEMAAKCAAITTEFENVPANVMTTLAEHVPVRPGPEAVAIAQDRIAEKTYLEREGFPTAPFHIVRTADDLTPAWDSVGPPALLKTARLGYDGKGQASVASQDALTDAFAGFHGASCVLERRLDLEVELSVVLARGEDGEIACFPPIENVHVNGILYTSTVPARVTPELANAAKDLALSLAARLEYVGVMAVEMFVAEGGTLFVNELAPRPHNSGHFTLDACVTDQFEQQVRALCGLPLGDPRLISPVTMINILGDLWHDGNPSWQEALSRHGVKLHLYGKHHPRPGRKMGHLNCLAGSPEESLALAREAHDALTTPVAPAVVPGP